MKRWTKQAEERLSEYLDARVRQEQLDGEDARELKVDLRAHVHEEAAREDGERVGVAELERVLRRLDLGRAGDELRSEQRVRWTKMLWFGGVVLPLGVTLFEALTGFCGGVFVDTMPTFLHGLLLLGVPLANGWLLTRFGQRASSAWQGVAAGVSVAVSAFYALLFVPLVPASCIAVIFFGIGLLSLTPILAWWASWRISRRRRLAVAKPWGFRQGWRLGALGVVVLLALLEGPGVWTRWQLSRALSDNPEVASSGLERLRSAHSERTLLRACYEGNRGTQMGTDISGWMIRGWQIPLAMLGERVPASADSQRVRDVFFRVTGKPFNSLRPPRMVREGGFMRGRGAAFEEFEFDDHLGGDDVAVRLKDLDLAESRFDGHIDGVSQLGYGEWTMVFHNRSPQDKEARCQVRLPPGGRVSRLTLWVNGEPREAAFSSVEKVKAAYREVAVVQRRDPVLVTVAGPDTVMVQCFPVPAHGEMKIRFGVTAPLDGARWELPRIVERNFGVEKGTEHALWVQADRAFEMGRSPGSRKDGEGFSSQAILPVEEVFGQSLAVTLGGVDERPAVVWCEDPFADPNERYLVRTPREGMRPAIDRLVAVVDGSASMKDEWFWISQTARKFPQVEVLIATDGVVEAGRADGYRFVGGRDNEPALREAVMRAKDAEHGAVVWLHGPQPVELTKSEALLQMLERGTRRPRMHEIEVVAGPNRLAASLGKNGVLVRGPTLFDPRRDLEAFFKELLEGGLESRWDWYRVGDVAEVEGRQVWNHLARQWAIEQSESNAEDRAKVAARYQLVTPVSGAVVLETAKQYEEADLRPVDANAAPSIPGVPEPSTSLLVMLGALAAMVRRRR